MKDSKDIFFDSTLISNLNRFINNYENHKFDDHWIEQLCVLSKMICHDIIKNSIDWSEKCVQSIKVFENRFTDYIPYHSDKNINEMEDFFIILLRFISEFSFHKSLNYDLFEKIENSILNSFSRFTATNQTQIIYVLYALPYKYIESLLKGQKFKIISEMQENLNQASKLASEVDEKIKSFEKSIDSKKAEIDKLDSKLEERRSTYNFVGLNKGFQDLESKKKAESNINLLALSLISIFMISIPLIISRIYFLSSDPESLLYLMPILSLELILIYFFRVFLIRFKEIKTQIMQLELRQALCQFIENYATYSNEIKAKDSAALEKFENLIFSGITSNPENIPSTFDGIDQIARLIQSIKNSK